MLFVSLERERDYFFSVQGNLLGEYRVEIEANLQSALECGDSK